MEEKATVYDRKGNPVIMQHVRGNSYEKLDKDGNSTGARVNLKLALEVRAYFAKPKVTANA